MLLFMPAAALHFIVAPQVRPAAFWQVELHVARFTKYRRYHDRISQHVLAIKIITRRIVRKLQHHRPHHGRTGFVGARRFPIQIRHHPALLFGEEAHHVTGLVVIGPRNPVGFATVQAAVAGEQAECAPPLVDMRRRGILESANIMTPEAKP